MLKAHDGQRRARMCSRGALQWARAALLRVRRRLHCATGWAIRRGPDTAHSAGWPTPACTWRWAIRRGPDTAHPAEFMGRKSPSGLSRPGRGRAQQPCSGAGRTIYATGPGRCPRHRMSQALRKRQLSAPDVTAHSMDHSNGGGGGIAMAHSGGCRAGRRYPLADRGRCLGGPILDAAILSGLPRRAAGMPRQAGAVSGEAFFRSPVGRAAQAGRDDTGMAGDCLPAERGASDGCHATLKNAAQSRNPGRLQDSAWPGKGSPAGRADALDGWAP